MLICRNCDSQVWKVHEAEVNFRLVYEQEPEVVLQVVFPTQVQSALSSLELATAKSGSEVACSAGRRLSDTMQPLRLCHWSSGASSPNALAAASNLAHGWLN